MTDNPSNQPRRPCWCPNPKCMFLLSIAEGGACVGRLPIPQAHEEGINTHNFCIGNSSPNDDPPEPFRLEIQSGDAWGFQRLMEAVKTDTKHLADVKKEVSLTPTNKSSL